MNVNALFGLSALMGILAWSVVARLYLWRRIRALPRHESIAVLIIPHLFRYLGLSFLIPGVVSPALPSAFAVPAAYGDFISMALAFVATLGLTRKASWAIAATWLFSVWGIADLLHAIFKGAVIQLDPGTLGAAYFILTVVVPALLVSHALIFWLLLQRTQSAQAPQ